MRTFVSIGLGLSLLAVTSAAPATAQQPDFLRRGHAPGAFGGGNRGPAGGGFNHGGPRFQPGQGGQRFGGGNGFERRRGGYGGAVGAGVAGLAAGALIGGALASRPSYGYGYGYGYGYDGGDQYAEPAPVYAAPPPEDYAEAAPADPGASEDYCARRYRSYDPGSGTYLGFDGYRHPCP